VNIYLYVIGGMGASFLLCIGTILFYLKYRRNIVLKQYQIKAAEVQHQKELLQAIITSQEEERKRIGMDLHDEVGSKLSSLKLTIDHFAEQEIQKIHGHQFNIQFKTMIDSIISNVRNISHNLSPLLHGTYGLFSAIQDFCDEVNNSARLNISVQIEEECTGVQLSNIEELTFYRVITELINNTIKHANASNASLTFLMKSNKFSIVYSDNGKGMLPGVTRGMGLKNIESRLSMIGAQYTILSNGGIGFQMSILLPVKNS